MESTFLVDNMFFVIAAMLSGGMLLWPLIMRHGAKEIDAQQAVRLINYEHAFVLDVRDDSDYASGHLPDSKNIPQALVKERLDELEKYKKKPIIIIFTPNLRAAQTGAILHKNGFERVFNLSGGIDGWKRENLPLVTK
ncbi:rhodanese-like domain-containing protein [Nitrosomonas mobilis]|uniref:Putative transmembrane protein n=1 Tax=Nitrosomonas mobilis TaxID=51642 RepID=A0A1G5SIJ9_9PROT|nr:rhodanese-like domain-containing protein [Nitrosomonas mobilis]SCZ86361.1 putative transmembrane protein [Nitrosomonas mobilis]HNO76291.1 rhodanese-like domain-containing protein [Nitrosomonas mobilis]